MGSFIDDLWIFKKDGVPLVEVLNNAKMDSSLLGIILTSLKSFSEEVNGKSLESLTIGNKKFTIIASLKNDIFIVGRTEIKVKDRKIMKSLEIIKEFFEDMYNINDIYEWNGDVSLFKKFKDKIELYFEMLDL